MTVVYYPGWGIYGREHFINSINFDDVSEISYAFFDVESDGSLRTIDNYEWAEKAFSAQDSISGVPDTWEDGNARGNQNQLAQLAEQYPDVSINIALGGWTLSDNFSTAVLDQNRDNLINNIVEMARDNPWITGFDMDWEFPGSGGQSGNTIRAEDGENYAKFLEGLNIALAGLSAETGQDYTISVASPPGLTQVDTFGFEYGVAEHADIINLMAYDYHGGWENNTGLQAGIFDDYSNTSSPGIAATIKAMIERGVDIEKVNLGIPLYARGWNIDPETEIANAIGAPSLSAVTGSFEAGIYDAKDILTTIANNPSEWTVVYDTDSMAAFALSETGEFVSIETRSTVALKAAWAKANDFNGLMFWDSSSDLEGTGASLVEAGNDVWEGRQTVADIIATDIIQFDQFIGSGEFYDLLTLDPTGLPISAIQAQENLNEQGAETDLELSNSNSIDGSTVPDEDIQVDMSETTEDSSEIADSINTDHAHDTENQGDLPSSDGASTVNPEVTAQNASHVITWAWGQKIVDSNFNPETDTIFFDWISADAVDITENTQGITISLPANNQSLTLSGIGLSDLKLSNINALDASTQNKLANLITSETTSSGDMSNDHYHDDHNQNDDGYVAGTMTSISLTSSDQIITSFEVATDMVHIEGGITADLLQIFQESGDSLGLTTRIVILDSVGNTVSTTIIKDVGLSDLTLANFSIAEQSAQNEIATAIGQTITGAPTNADGYDIIYDSNDGIPSVTTGTTPEGGAKYRGDINANDVFDFDISRDQIDVGETSVHNLIITKTANGEIAIDSPWTSAMQIFQGVKIADLTMDNFATVGNEHLRQDLGGVMSWELGVGPRDSNTVYVRSHEYGVHEVIDSFDPSAMKISFLYFGTRERLTVEDTDAGLKIWSMPSGQSITFTDITKSDLIPGLIEFHHDQIIEDNLETPFGISASDLTLVDRTVLLTPEAPLGSTTDGFQTHLGNLTGANENTDVPINISSSTLNDDSDGSDAPTSLTGFNTVNFTNSQSDSASLTWEWANKTAITGFNTETDFFDFGNMSADTVNVEEADGNLYFEVLGMGGNITALVGVQAEDLSSENLTAAEWNDVLDADSILIESLVSLGYDFG
ncbi:MAG: glycosyl hydrolase family 18 protein [Tateyamaria sp.]|nr:glycosyl hydrolase family 18 protein [Tateyamaria sp.]